MGQGTVTSLSMLLAEELECDWKKIRTEFPGIDRAFGNQGVVGSQSIRSSWQPLRQAGAAAREMLIQAAAQRWGVDRSQCRAENSVVLTPPTSAATLRRTGRAAAKLPPPAGVALKDPRRLQDHRQRRASASTRPTKSTGKATFGIDVRVPDMLHAVVTRCPVFGGKVASFDAAKTKAMPGVKHVVADLLRRGRGRRQYLERHPGAQRALHPMGRGPARQRQQRRHPQGVDRALAASRARWAARMAMRRRARRRREEDRSRLRSPLSGARSHGAAQQRGRRARR